MMNWETCERKRSRHFQSIISELSWRYW